MPNIDRSQLDAHATLQRAGLGAAHVGLDALRAALFLYAVARGVPAAAATAIGDKAEAWVLGEVADALALRVSAPVLEIDADIPIIRE